MIDKVPFISGKIVCICDRKRADLAAVILTYLADGNRYIPIFEFPSVTGEFHERNSEQVDEHTLTLIRGSEAATSINNAIARIGNCEILIFAGLSVEQKTYLDFSKGKNIVEIDDVSEIDFYLSTLVENREKFYCRKEEVLVGVQVALEQRKFLAFDESTELVLAPKIESSVLIILEEENTVSAIAALNYSNSIKARVELVAPLDYDDELTIKEYISNWREGDVAAYKEIENRVNSRVAHIDFSKFSYATFFTWGLPYSLILKNILPFTYVNLKLRSDLFVINCIIYENENIFGGAVNFSPQYFKDEETKTVSRILEREGFYVKELIGTDATTSNLDYCLKEFPFDILHICSHGGEIIGSRVSEEFTDSKGETHLVEYESVLSFSPSSEPGKLKVQEKVFYKVFDGFKWRSPQLKAKYDHYVFTDMQNEMHSHKGKNKKVIQKGIVVKNSCAIKTKDGNHQGMFQTIASHSCPIIFNNACWSWGEIAENFLTGGARGYIGTFWELENNNAVIFADSFYTNIFFQRVADSFHNASLKLAGSTAENIYMFWGLHFCTLKTPTNIDTSKLEICRQLSRSHFMWERHLKKPRSHQTRMRVRELMHWISTEIRANFKKEMILLHEEFLEFIRGKKNPKD